MKLDSCMVRRLNLVLPPRERLKYLLSSYLLSNYLFCLAQTVARQQMWFVKPRLSCCVARWS